MICEGFHVRITREAYEKIQAYIDLCPLEISGFGVTEVQSDGILIKDAFLINQVVTAATTEMNTDAVFQAVMDAAATGQDTSSWGCWFHSHVNFAANFSGTDISTMEKLKADTPLISLVMNKSHQYSLWVDIYQPFRLTMKDLSLEVVYPQVPGLREDAKEEIQQKVRQLKASPIVNPLPFRGRREPYLVGSEDDPDMPSDMFRIMRRPRLLGGEAE